MKSKGVEVARTALIPAGVFRMGDNAGRPDERPEHDVYVSSFRMAISPVTNREYAVFCEATGHQPARFHGDPLFSAPEQPVVGVNWWDATEYCAWLSEATGRRFRLPTEGEREKAARGGAAGLSYPWGDDAGVDGGRFEQNAPRVVGESLPNGYGVHDLACNVHEWCSDWYDPHYYAASPSRDPIGPPAGVRRASRGGAWRHQIKIRRCAARSSLNPDFRYNDYGFRVVESVE
jgi:formylglycine-generating enzyme required for sulfatase activity